MAFLEGVASCQGGLSKGVRPVARPGTPNDATELQFEIRISEETVCDRHEEVARDATAHFSSVRSNRLVCGAHKRFYEPGTSLMKLQKVLKNISTQKDPRKFRMFVNDYYKLSLRENIFSLAIKSAWLIITFSNSNNLIICLLFKCNSFSQNSKNQRIWNKNCYLSFQFEVWSPETS